MNTPTSTYRLSASSAGITPACTLSATARATAACAGPNIWTACLAPLIVTLLNSSVLGLQGRFGAITANNDVNPSLLFDSEWQNALSAALPRGPIIRSMCATSLPSPTSDSPTRTLVIFAIRLCSFSSVIAASRKYRVFLAPSPRASATGPAPCPEDFTPPGSVWQQTRLLQ